MNRLLLFTFSLWTGFAAAQTPAWRAVWVQPGADGTAQIMARESGQPARALTAAPGDFTRPFLSPDGKTVYFTALRATAAPEGTLYDPLIHSVDFTGGQPQPVTAGLGLTSFTEEGKPVLFALTGLQTSRKPVPAGDMVVKFSPLTPDEREIMWTESPVSPDNFQLSRDGLRAAGLFPWPQAGLANMEDRTFQPLAQGAFPALAPDNSYSLALLSPDRRRIRIFAPGVTPDWELDPAPHLPFQTPALNHLRWTSHPLHLVFTASPAGSESSDVFLATLRPDLKSITAITRITEGTQSKAWPDVWLPGSAALTTGLAQKPAPVAPAAPAVPWPASRDALVFAWEKTGSPANTAAFTPEGWVHPARHGALNITGGRASAPPDAAEKIAADCARSGAFTLQALITERTRPQICSRRFLTLADPDGRDLLALYRVDNHLILRVRTGPPGHPPYIERHTLTPLAVEDDRPFHLTLTLHGRALTCYIDGVKMKDYTLDQPGLTAWQGPAQFYTGDPAPYGQRVPATISHIALHSRALAAEETADAWRALENTLPPRPTRHKTKLKLLTPAPPGDPGQPTTLSGSIWEVEQVFTGFVKPKTITLLQWATLNGHPAPVPVLNQGQSIELFISDIEEQPDLRSLPISYAPGAEAHPCYFDTTELGSHPAPFPP